MRLQIILLVCVFALPITVFADEPLGKRISGTWRKTGHEFSFNIQKNSWKEYVSGQPFKPSNEGEVTFPRGKDYAIVKAKTGHVFWLFSAGEDVLAVETFDKEGKILGDGRVFYREGVVIP